MIDVLNLAADTNITDESIVGKVLTGDKDAYEVIVRRYNSRLYKIARTYIKDEDDIEDVLQETYVKAYLNLKQFKGNSKLSTWLTRILINESLACLNKQSKKVSFVDEQLLNNMEQEQNMEQKIIQKNVKEILEKSIDNLPPKLSSVFVMREIEGMNVKDTSELLEISEENVKVRLHRAKTALKETISNSLKGVNLFSFMGERCDLFSRKLMARIQGL